jgi:glycosyltransferase involved in cell wall biosynthesis
LFEKYILTRNYTFYHAISASTQNDLIKSGVDSRLIAAIYPGVKIKGSEPNGRRVSNDNPPPANSEERSQTFLYFGRPGKPKGIFVLFDAIKAIRNQLPEGFRFTYIVSNKPLGEKNRLRRLVEKYALEDVVAIKDPLAEEDLVRAIKDAYCVIVPSITEGFGLSAAEACMLGKPVIVSDAGSLPEVAFGKVLFFQNRNSSDLATKILLATEGKFERLPERNFDWNISTRRLLDLYQNLTKNQE